MTLEAPLSMQRAKLERVTHDAAIYFPRVLFIIRFRP